MINKRAAISTTIILTSVITLFAICIEAFALQTINPAATVAAITVVFVGIIWLKKTNS